MSETKYLYSYDIKTENGYFVIAVSDMLTGKNISCLNLLGIKDGFHINLIRIEKNQSTKRCGFLK